MRKARSDAMEMRMVTPKMVLYPSLAHRASSDQGSASEMTENRINKAVVTNPASTNMRATLFPYTSPTISVMRNTNGNENTATERCEPNKNGMSFKPSVIAATSEVRYIASAMP